ncbi:MAG: peptidylprolyl isomerase [Rhizobacter sp.]|nr:peptidylprolyl isomerase [Rhizobacter sp.]
MTLTRSWPRIAVLSLLLVSAYPGAIAQPRASAPRTADYIVAIVNQELVTNGELQLRLNQVRENARRANAQLPPADVLRQQVLDALIDERVQITHARESGQRLDDAEVERAVTNVAAQNQLTPTQLRERLRREGVDYLRFRNNVRDQLLLERTREREVQARIRITDTEIENWLDKQRAEAGAATEYNIAQVLVTVPEGASESVVAERRARADAAMARLRRGEAFDVVAREVSEDTNRAKGGEIGSRPANRLPDIFVDAVRPLKAGEVSPTLLRSGAGFHILKLVERSEAGALTINQTRARHILLRPSAQLSQQAAAARLVEFKRQIASGARSFEQLARDNSEDGSAAQGGDLGWVSPGNFVPEFEEAMNALAINGLSEPVVSRFGVHLIQVIERRKMALDAKQQREQARAALREQKFEEAYAEWVRELRARAYVEMREPPQ